MNTISFLFISTFDLLRKIGIGRIWLFKAMRLTIFSFCLIPAWIRIGKWYIFSKNVIFNISYGNERRNSLDIFLPSSEQLKATTMTTTTTKKPVIVIMSGGAWMISYKAWGALLAKYLSEEGCIVVCPDYRNFPQGDIESMIDDLNSSLSWVSDNIEKYGGDKCNITLVGQSAGAHISSLWLLRRAFLLSSTSNESNVTKTKLKNIQIQNFVGLSGPYNLLCASNRFERHGLSKNLLTKIMKNSIRQYSPYHYLLDSIKTLKEIDDKLLIDDVQCNSSTLDRFKLNFPPVTLVHGLQDYTVNSLASKDFSAILSELKVSNELILLDDRNHTDLTVEDLMRGKEEFLLSKLLDLSSGSHIKNGHVMTNNKISVNRQWRYKPIRTFSWLVRLARRINPF